MLNGRMDTEKGLKQLHYSGARGREFMNDDLLPNPHLDDEE
jgi:hypothetical protein